MGDFIIQKKAAGNFSLFPEKVSHIYTQINFCSFTLTSFNTNQKPYFFFQSQCLTIKANTAMMFFYQQCHFSCPVKFPAPYSTEPSCQCVF